MNLILLSREDFIDDTCHARLQGRRLRHVLEVHRAEVGDELSVGVLGGRIGTGKVTLLTPSVLEMDVLLERMPPPALPDAHPRPAEAEVLRRVLRSVSAMG
jgi:16S rRNA U1498 N3-methylase RsmE